jgi:hypothetical protein
MLSKSEAPLNNLLTVTRKIAKLILTRFIRRKLADNKKEKTIKIIWEPG